MRKRCTDPKAQNYERYGGRGITVCAEWMHDFQAFFDHVGKRPSPEHSLDRIKNHLGYAPGNVRWATRKEQARNRRSTVLVSDGAGVEKTVAEWAEGVGLPYHVVHGRLKIGWSLADALLAPYVPRPRAASRGHGDGEADGEGSGDRGGGLGA